MATLQGGGNGYLVNLYRKLQEGGYINLVDLLHILPATIDKIQALQAQGANGKLPNGTNGKVDISGMSDQEKVDYFAQLASNNATQLQQQSQTDKGIFDNLSNNPFSYNYASQSGFNNSDEALSAYLQYLAAFDTDADFRHGSSQDLLNWLQTLNQREYEQGLTQEQRQYNEKVLAEQRQYDSPQAMLQRLMATGMSRQAALQLIGQGGVGASSGSSGLIGSPSLGSGPLGAAEYNQAGGTTYKNHVGAAMDIVNTCSNLASLAMGGISLMSTLNSAALAGEELISATMKNDAANSVGGLMSSIYSSKPDGSPFARPSDGEVRNAEGLLSWCQNVSREDNPYVYDFVRSPKFKQFANNPYAWSLYDKLYGDHSNAAQEKTESDYILMSEMLMGQKRLQDIEIDLNGDNLRTVLDQNEATRDLIPWLKDRDLYQVQNDIFLLLASQSPDQLAYRLDYISNHNQTLAYMSFCELAQAGALKGLVENDPLYKNALGVGAFLNQMGFGQGIVGDGTRLMGMTASGVTTGVSNLFGQFENSHPLDALSGTTTKVGSYIKEKAKKFGERFTNFFKNIGKKKDPNTFVFTDEYNQ